MKSILFYFSSILLGAFIALIFTFSFPDDLMAGTCSDDCMLLCGDPGNVVCGGITCEGGSTICTKADGDPGVPPQPDK